MAEERYAILLEDDVAVDPRKYGEIVAPALGRSLVEARMAVRRGRGIFLENLAEEHALRIARELERDGIRSLVVSNASVPPLPPPRKAVHVERGDDVLGFQAGGGPEALPWEAILVASLGVVARPEYAEYFAHVPFRMIPPIHKLEGGERELVRENLILKMSAAPSDGRPARRRRPRDEGIFDEIEQKHSRRVRTYLDLVTSDLGTWLRVPLEELAFVYSAGSPRLGGAWGFGLLMNVLRDRRPEALTDLGLKLLEAADIKDHVFPQIEEFTRYTAWVALRRFLWPNAASSSPSPAPPASPTDGGSSSASPGPAPPSTSS